MKCLWKWEQRFIEEYKANPNFARFCISFFLVSSRFLQYEIVKHWGLSDFANYIKSITHLVSEFLRGGGF